MPPLSPLRSLILASSIASLALVAGCQRPSLVDADQYPNVDLKAQEAFVHQMSGVLSRDALSATGARLYGALNLKVTLDLNSSPVACTTGPAKPELVAHLPKDTVLADPASLARVVEAQCWKTIYPVVPRGFFDDKGVVEFVAPLVLMPPEENAEPAHALQIRLARQQFFWQAVVRDEPVQSIGRALFRYQTDAAGKITGCLVQLAPTDVRPDAYRVDSALQARLNSRCMGVQTPDIAGFSPDPQSPELGFAIVEYAPWKVGRR